MSGTPGILIVESLVRELLDRETGRAVVKVTSSSMSPRIEAGDLVSIVRAEPRSLLPGDVVVFRSDEAGLVVHRVIWRNNPLGQPTHVFTKGDASGCLDRSVSIDRIVGRVEGIDKGGGHRSPTTPLDRVRCLLLAARYGARRWVRRRLVRDARQTRPEDR
ncbi:MAG TPA: signal peptidase I [Candidatus Polarisedimenticolia bacterium]|jgi:signal peptidase I